MPEAAEEKERTRELSGCTFLGNTTVKQWTRARLPGIQLVTCCIQNFDEEEVVIDERGKVEKSRGNKVPNLTAL